MKNIAILGSTGSIGTQTLEIVRNNPDLVIKVLACNSNIKVFEAQVREFKPDICVVCDEKAAVLFRENVKDMDVKVLSGMDGLIEAAVYEPVETVVTSMVGMIGIRPTIAAIEAHKDIAFANKETLVCAGHIIMPLARKCGVRILPVDSEHSAIFQSLNGENPDNIEKILLTASGGPFRGMNRESLENMKASDALKHPNWSMGRKITIDSATLVNKGLEVMEAKWLFNVDADRIEVVIHPQSIIHSMVQFKDGAIIGQMGLPDMKLPIQYALFYPDRRVMNSERVDFFKLQSMTFEKPDPDTFRGLKLAGRAMREGGSMPTVFNAANERAVALFLDDKIGFMDIPRLIETAMDKHTCISNPTVDDILMAEKESYEVIDSVSGIYNR